MSWNQHLSPTEIIASDTYWQQPPQLVPIMPLRKGVTDQLLGRYSGVISTGLHDAHKRLLDGATSTIVPDGEQPLIIGREAKSVLKVVLDSRRVVQRPGPIAKKETSEAEAKAFDARALQLAQAGYQPKAGSWSVVRSPETGYYAYIQRRALYFAAASSIMQLAGIRGENMSRRYMIGVDEFMPSLIIGQPYLHKGQLIKFAKAEVLTPNTMPRFKPATKAAKTKRLLVPGGLLSLPAMD